MFSRPCSASAKLRNALPANTACPLGAPLPPQGLLPPYLLQEVQRQQVGPITLQRPTPNRRPLERMATKNPIGTVDATAGVGVAAAIDIPHGAEGRRAATATGAETGMVANMITKGDATTDPGQGQEIATTGAIDHTIGEITNVITTDGTGIGVGVVTSIGNETIAVMMTITGAAKDVVKVGKGPVAAARAGGAHRPKDGDETALLSENAPLPQEK